MLGQKAFDIFCHGKRAKSGTLCGGKQKNMHCVNWCMLEAMLKGTTEEMVQLVECLFEALGSVSV